MIHENWRFRPWYRALRAEIDAGPDRPADPAADRAPRHPAPAARRLRRSAVPGHDAPADPDGDGLSPGGHRAIPARRDPDGLGDHRPLRARDTSGEDVAMLSLVLRRRGARLARPELVHAARRRPPGMGAEPDRRRGHRRHAPAPDRRLARVGQPRRHVASGGRSPCPPTTRSMSTATPPPSGISSTACSPAAEHETRASDNLKTMDVIWAAYRSAEEGRTLSV